MSLIELLIFFMSFSLLIHKSILKNNFDNPCRWLMITTTHCLRAQTACTLQSSRRFISLPALCLRGGKRSRAVLWGKGGGGPIGATEAREQWGVGIDAARYKANLTAR